MSIDKYLQRIQKDESIFPMDSPHHDPTRRRKKIMRGKREVMAEQKTSPKRVMIDFDRTIHKYSEGWKDGSIYDAPFEGAKEGVQWFRDQGYQIVIFTARVAKGENDDYAEQEQAVKAYLKKYEIPFDMITAEKLAAEFYIDDRAVYIPNGNWDYVISEVQQRLSKSG
jgi:hypothetical protein